MTAFWCELPRDVLRVTGADASTYLQSQISQDIRGLGDGQSTYTFVLQPTGKVVSLARLQRIDAEEFLVDTDAGFGPALAARLNRFKIRVKVDIHALDWRMIAVRGIDTTVDGAVAAWGLPDAVDILGAEPVAPQDVAEATAAALELARIEAGWPAMGTEITDATIPAETGVVPLAVSFTKGCYPGQELVERMDSRGSNAPRFVRRLRGSGTAESGATLHHDGKDVGTLTSVASTDGGWVALAIVARSVAVGDAVVLDLSGESAESFVEEARA